ncbi:MAG TPA: dual specificity protein phosphatase family protein [Blastocatellia bacterium]|nr:dual specificity protein phosphatase family protein [Blastocatellia bacterium]
MKTELYWIESDLAILMRPRGGDWLSDEIQDWKRDGLNVIVSLLDAKEARDLNLTNEAHAVQAAGLTFISFPVTDFGVPDHLLDTIKLIDSLVALRAEGKRIGIHCRQGLGRAPLIAACLLVRGGVAPEKAWRIIGSARGTTVPETDEQREWLNRFAEELRTLSTASS